MYISRNSREQQAKEELRARLSDWDDSDITSFIDRQYPDYWLRTELDKQIEHAKLMRRSKETGQQLATSFRSDAFKGMTELAILAPNHPRLLALFAGC